MNLIQTIAIAIDSDIHKSFVDRSAIKSKEFRHYYQLLKKFQETYPEFSSLSTLNYREEDNSIRIGIEILEQEFDSIWLLTSHGLIQVYYDNNSQEFFVSHFSDKQYKLKRLEKDITRNKIHELKDNTLYIDETEILDLAWKNNSIVARIINHDTKNKQIVDKWNRYAEFMQGKASLNYIDAGEYGINPGHKFIILNESIENITKNITECISYKQELIDYYWIQCPIRNRNNEIGGVIGGDLDASEIRKIQNYSIYASLFLFGISFFFILSVYIYFNRNILRPLKDILFKINSIAQGSIDIRVEAKYMDEYNQLSFHFNHMMDTIQGLTEIQKKFIPSQFIDLIGKKRLNELKLGDNKEFDFSVLFSDIRGFTNIAEKLSVKENFNFINSYLERIGPSIRKEGGFIDKYIGDGIMAIFPNSPKSAILSAIELQESVHDFNKNIIKHGIEKITVGVGIHYGSIMMGIIGEEERYEATVLSDAVNLASRLEGLTKNYGCSIVVSGETIEQAGDLTGIPYRLIDVVRVKGKNKPVFVYEILAGYSQRIIDMKLSTQSSFSQGLDCLRNKMFNESMDLFQKVLNLDPLDKVALIHLEQSKFFLKSGVPESWEGIRNLDFK